MRLFRARLLNGLRLDVITQEISKARTSLFERIYLLGFVGDLEADRALVVAQTNRKVLILLPVTGQIQNSFKFFIPLGN